jgi:hypothetical protein
VPVPFRNHLFVCSDSVPGSWSSRLVAWSSSRTAKAWCCSHLQHTDGISSHDQRLIVPCAFLVRRYSLRLPRGATKVYTVHRPAEEALLHDFLLHLVPTTLGEIQPRSPHNVSPIASPLQHSQCAVGDIRRLGSAVYGVWTCDYWVYCWATELYVITAITRKRVADVDNVQSTNTSTSQSRAIQTMLVPVTSLERSMARMSEA